MNKQNALQYLRHQIEKELELIKYIHNTNKKASVLSKGQIISKESKQFLKATEDIHLLSVTNCISNEVANELLKTIESARTFIEV